MRHVVRLVAVVLGLAVVALIPMLQSVIDFTQNIRGVFDAADGASTGEFGHLARALPPTEAAGVWISREYRYPADGPFNNPFVAVAVAAAVAGLVLCVVRRWFAAPDPGRGHAVIPRCLCRRWPPPTSTARCWWS